MKIIYNSIIPVTGFSAINLFSVLFVRKGVIISDRLMRHESIHTAQMRELCYVFFYLFYFSEWVLRLFKYRSKAYYNISFEREAYKNEEDSEYLKSRKQFAFIKFL